MNRTITRKELPHEEFEELANAYGTNNLEAYSFDPPLEPSLLGKVRTLDVEKEAGDSDASAWIITVSSAQVVLGSQCGNCEWNLLRRIAKIVC